MRVFASSKFFCLLLLPLLPKQLGSEFALLSFSIARVQPQTLQVIMHRA